jgi:hypothetical protein
MLEMVDKLPSEKACLYDEFMEAQHQQATAKKYKGKLPSHELKSGLQITLVTCNYKDIGEVKVILHKQQDAVMIQSLARRPGTRSSNCWTQKSLLGI